MSARWMYPRQTFIERAVTVARECPVIRKNWEHEAHEALKQEVEQ